MSRRIVFNILFFILGATAFAAVPDTLLLHMYDNPMHHLYQVREKSEEDRSKYLFNADTLFYRYATEGYAALPDELYYYYHDYVSYMSLEEAEKEVRFLKKQPHSSQRKSIRAIPIY